MSNGSFSDSKLENPNRELKELHSSSLLLANTCDSKLENPNRELKEAWAGID